MPNKPKPRFRVRQVVATIEGGEVGRVTSRQLTHDITTGCPFYEYCLLHIGYRNEPELRPLTAREIGPGWVRKEGKRG